jgi:O-antigen/teichoic acid export membrane protein
MSVSGHLKNLSANLVQLVLNQLSGVVVFLVLSGSLSKRQFGDFNWALAVLLAGFNLLTMGIDQLMVRKIAMLEDEVKATGLYFTHMLISGLCFWGLILLLWLLLPCHPEQLYLLLILGVGKLMIYFSSPFKQLANGKERFRLLTMMSIGSGLIKCFALLAMWQLHLFTLQMAAGIFVLAETTELVISIAICKFYLKTPISFSFNLDAYKALIKEARHQAGVVLFTSALSRFDWIFIGLFLSSVSLAEYSFAYKIFEVSTLPLAAIGALLLPRFSKLFQGRANFAPALFNLLDWEIAFAVLTALVLNLCWRYFADPFTGYKYGAVNAQVILILSLSIPFLYINNFLWSIAFAKGRTKLILQIFAITFGVNLSADLLLIPLLGNAGAALGYLMAIVVQSILFCRAVREARYRPVMVACANLVLAGSIGLLACRLFIVFLPVVLFAITLYVTGIGLFKQLKPLSPDLIENTTA